MSLAEKPPTQVRGSAPADVIWEGLVEVADDFQVPAGRTLRILAGTRVMIRPADTTRTEPEFLDNATEILIRGNLWVEGTAGRPVVFEPSPGDDRPSDGAGYRWGGLIFDRGGGFIRHSRISGAETGVTLLDAGPRLEDVEIDGVRQGISIHGGSAPVLSRIRVRSAEGGILCWSGSSPTLEAVDAEAGEHEGLLVAPGSEPRLKNCRFRGPAAGILWGAASPPTGATWGDATLRLVAPPPGAPDPIPGPTLPFVPPERPPKSAPDRIYLGERFIGEDTTWEGEILIDGTVMVAPVAQLTVAPGTVVRFTFRDSDADGIGESEIFMQGRLAAVGTPDRPIVFTAAGEQGPGRWGALNLMGSDARESVMAWCLVESSYRGLHSHFSRFRVESSVFRNNHRSLQFQESTAAVLDCAVTGSTSGLRFRDSTVALEGLAVFGNTLGIQTQRSTFSLTRSTVSGNTLAGIHIRESEGAIGDCEIAGNAPGLRVSDSHLRVEANRFFANNIGGLMLRRTEARVTGNRFEENHGNAVSTDSPRAVFRGNGIAGSLRFAVENNAVEAVDAAENWWGAEGPTADLFFDRDDDPRLGPVLTEPALRAPPAR